jgi:peptidoglycan-associated lipoprotein
VVVGVFLISCVLALTGCSKRGKKAGDSLTGSKLGDESMTSVLPSRPGYENLKVRDDLKVENVLFEYDSAQINESERGKIEIAASILKSNSGVDVIIEGHCDERGSAEYNMALGERRALAVRAILMNLGIDGNRIQTRSYGEERPVSPGHDESAWRLNRRCEFVFFDK